jgi:putative ABC transport system permease protein
MRVLGLAMGNALVGLTGALLAQYQGYADLSSGTGMVMVGLACVIIGELFGGHRSVTWGLVSAVIGSVVYRLIIQVALSLNLFDANMLKLLSAVIVGVFMAVPAIQSNIRERRERKQAMEAMEQLLANETAGGDHE